MYTNNHAGAQSCTPVTSTENCPNPCLSGVDLCNNDNNKNLGNVCMPKVFSKFLFFLPFSPPLFSTALSTSNHSRNPCRLEHVTSTTVNASLLDTPLHQGHNSACEVVATTCVSILAPKVILVLLRTTRATLALALLAHVGFTCARVAKAGWLQWAPRAVFRLVGRVAMLLKTLVPVEWTLAKR